MGKRAKTGNSTVDITISSGTETEYTEITRQLQRFEEGQKPDFEFGALELVRCTGEKGMHLSIRGKQGNTVHELNLRMEEDLTVSIYQQLRGSLKGAETNGASGNGHKVPVGTLPFRAAVPAEARAKSRV